MPSAESIQAKAMIREMMAPTLSGQIPVTIEQMRQFLDQAGLANPMPPNITVEKLSVNGIPAEWVSGPEADPNRVLLYLHGGAYAIGSCDSHRELAAQLSLSSGARVLLPEYRLAPENPFPAGIEDAVAAYRWLLANGTKPEKIVIGGDSAGGGLTLATLLSLRDAGDPMPAGAILLSPWTDLTASGESYTTRAEHDPMLTTGSIPASVQTYIGENGDPRNSLVSPIFADLTGLPPLLIHVGHDEILLDDATGVAKNAEAAGVEVKLRVWDGMWHVFQQAAGIPERDEAIAELGEFVHKRTS